MALKNKLDPEAVRRNLETWLSRKLDHASDVHVTDADIPQASGISANTILFSAEWREDGRPLRGRFVARAVPRVGAVFEHCDLAREFRLLRALEQADAIAVPKALWVETQDDSVLGMPFLVMDFVAGRVARDDPPYTAAGWVMELTDDERRTLSDRGIDTLAALHAIDPAEHGLAWIADDAMAVPDMAGKLEGQARFLDWTSDGERYPVIERAFAWLRERIPATESGPVISWGDARLGNMIIGDDLNVAAVIDWEMVGLGAREFDLAWWIFTRRFHTSAMGIALPGGFPPEAELIERYAARAGYQPQNLDVYIVFAGLRLSIIYVRLSRMMIAEGMLPPDSPMAFNNPALNLLGSCIGEDGAAEGVLDFVGRR